ncbi:MAG: alanine--tRNA ligase [Candidatus Harrisonbacteria bacterium CG10_big_fil_rev_8_21_14_0_10_44_23]|uniref:alanine--tRNA ligase n=1 Tax=Candidatus Harrisonbacteria bacterium CG10_big_fil_rev_8_21_14_0_10_44_23 TaxID=1974585 RepID=A0A2H0UPS5_9BACT|nr:MAG: alanine--tRNA ligase [Candidatus Harrisonbacteria bacterium CG10_big_fil_rev_8_21_14_0_10_44_23]
MTAQELRDRFINYFTKRGHAHVPSSSLLPDDPSVLLTTAGMQQFKPYFLGDLDAQKDFGSLSTVSIQKSFRTSDIEEVGDDTHLTFFEMLGNFSFGYKPGEPGSSQGGYFKKEAIEYAHQFITKELGLEISYVTVFKGSPGVEKDNESIKIWSDLGVKNIKEEGIEDVFWGPTGNSGPCGPTTEIYCKNAKGEDVEIWNIVFNQFLYNGSREDLINQNPDKELQPLQTPGIDTGAGFERLLTILQGKDSPYETELFEGVMGKIGSYGEIPQKTQRVLADHIRATAFLITDGVRPSNKEAGYILRRLMRRVLAHQNKHQLPKEFISALLSLTTQNYIEAYPELKLSEIEAIYQEEHKKFIAALEKATKELSKHSDLTAQQAFSISSTLGISFDLMKEISPEALRGVSQEDFDTEFKKHQELSRAGAEKKFGGHGLILDTGELKAENEEELQKVLRLHTATHLLQQALRDVLGPEVGQAGSDINSKRLRFDFTFGRKLEDAEKQEVENIVNSIIAKNLPVKFEEMGQNEAKNTGALYFFKEKYPEKVKVYYVGENIQSAFSKEFCGGPHVGSTGEIGKFKIIKEESIGSGKRRIKAAVE